MTPPSSDIIIAGAGLSIHQFDWQANIGTPIMGISSGALHVPEMSHFVSCDKPVHFPDWLVNSDRFEKHVPLNRWWANWNIYPRAISWRVTELHEPGFQEPQDITQSGPLPRNHSLLFGVQVAAQLGFKRCVFIGCDLLTNELWPISEVLQSWHPRAQACGIEWVNASHISTLSAWMPAAEEMVVI